MLIPTGALVVLDGPSGSGTSSWATANFRTDQVVSSDALRALVRLAKTTSGPAPTHSTCSATSWSGG